MERKRKEDMEEEARFQREREQAQKRFEEEVKQKREAEVSWLLISTASKHTTYLSLRLDVYQIH